LGTDAAASLVRPTKVTSPAARRRRLAFSRRSLSLRWRDRPPAAGGRLEGLFDEIIGAGLIADTAVSDRAVAADHHHGNRRFLAPDDVEELQAVGSLPCSPDVEDNQRRPALAHGVDRSVLLWARRAVLPSSSRMPAIKRADVAFVVDDENIGP